MKKLYATICAALLGTSAMMAEEGTFSFVHNGEVVPNGGTVTLTDVELETDLGDIKVWEMKAGLYVRNNSNAAERLGILATGVDNYNDIQVCPDGSCRPWSNGVVDVEFKEAVAAGALADTEIHTSFFDFTGNGPAAGTSTITVKAYCPLDPDDCTTVTLVFDTTKSSLVKVEQPVKVEVFNLCGKKIADTTTGLTQGIYIIRKNGTSHKVTIK